MGLEFIPAWANAIAQFEGYNSPANRAARNHNPGNLKYAGQAGTAGRDPNGFAIFSSDVLGWQALYNQLQKYVHDYPNDSILEITAHYLGQGTPTSDAQGNAFTYAAVVASALGVDISTTLGQLAGGGTQQGPAPALPIPYELTADSSQASPDVPGMPIESPGTGFGTNSLVLFASLGLGAWLVSRSWG